MFKATIPIFFI